MLATCVAGVVFIILVYTVPSEAGKLETVRAPHAMHEMHAAHDLYAVPRGGADWTALRRPSTPAAKESATSSNNCVPCSNVIAFIRPHRAQRRELLWRAGRERNPRAPNDSDCAKLVPKTHAPRGPPRGPRNMIPTSNQ